MTNVREASFSLLRRHGMTTIFGNPGSTELPMLHDFPADFRYVLALQEAVAVGMADGFAQASATVGHVNLHTAPGVGNAMGALFNARANKTPLLVTAGQQVRAHITMGANLTNAESTTVPTPFVKWSFEPPRAQDVPAALARAIHCSALPPGGPAFVSVPMDDWTAPVCNDSDQVLDRTVTGRAGAPPDVVAALARRIEGAANPCFVAGPDVDAAGAWQDAVALVERCRMTVFATPATGGGRLGFPENHSQFHGILPPAIAPLAAALAPYDLVVCAGTSIFPYYPYLPGRPLVDNTALVAITNDPAEAARAPAGDAIVADVGLTLRALLQEVDEADRPTPVSWAAPTPAGETSPLSAARVYDVLAEILPADAIIVLESPSSTGALRHRLRISRPGSYYFGAGGGLGFGLSAAVGVQLAQPSRPVVCVLGEGSAQYAITAFWTAATYRVPVTFLVLRNDEYGILKWFADIESVTGAPGLDLPNLDVLATAASYGVPGQRAGSGSEDLRVKLLTALGSSGPALVEVPVTSGMALL